MVNSIVVQLLKISLIISFTTSWKWLKKILLSCFWNKPVKLGLRLGNVLIKLGNNVGLIINSRIIFHVYSNSNHVKFPEVKTSFRYKLRTLALSQRAFKLLQPRNNSKFSVNRYQSLKSILIKKLFAIEMFNLPPGSLRTGSLWTLFELFAGYPPGRNYILKLSSK